MDPDVRPPAAEALRTQFWADVTAPLPDVRLARVDSLTVAQGGPGGLRVYEIFDLVLPHRSLRCLATFKPKLLAGEALNLRKKLLELADELRLRSGGGQLTPTLVTDVAAPSTIEACLRSGTALLDLRGTVMVRTDDVFIHVLGNRSAKRLTRAPAFSGKGSRVVRRLLNEPSRRPTIRQLSEEVETAYSYVHGVVELLVSEGFAEYRGRSGGVVVRDPRGLLMALRDRGARPSAAVESFNVRATTPEALRKGAELLERLGSRFAFTLASGLAEHERFVAALPHGVYCSAGLDVLTEAFSLRKQSPANFFILRPRPALDTDAGGVFDSTRRLPWGPAVAVPELIVDLVHSGGRGREQADQLLEVWAKALPLQVQE